MSSYAQELFRANTLLDVIARTIHAILKNLCLKDVDVFWDHAQIALADGRIWERLGYANLPGYLHEFYMQDNVAEQYARKVDNHVEPLRQDIDFNKEFTAITPELFAEMREVQALQHSAPVKSMLKSLQCLQKIHRLLLSKYTDLLNVNGKYTGAMDNRVVASMKELVTAMAITGASVDKAQRYV